MSLTVEQIAKAIKIVLDTEGQPAEARQVYLRDCEVTACIGTYNAGDTLGQVLKRLAPGFQEIPVHVILCDTGSTDWTPAIIEHFARNAEDYKLRSVQVLPAIIHHEDRGSNYAHVRAKLIAAVETPYLWAVDADVIPPAGCAGRLLEELKTREDLGAIGCMYNHTVDHVQWGCTVYRTELLKKMDIGVKGCTCRYIQGELEKLGKTVEHIQGLYAEHRRLKQPLPNA